jgi:hypothetical protein
VGEVDVVAGVKAKVGVLAGVGAGGRALLLLWGVTFALLLESEVEFVLGGVWRSCWSEDWCVCCSRQCWSGAGRFWCWSLFKLGCSS